MIALHPSWRMAAGPLPREALHRGPAQLALHLRSARE